RIPLKLEDVTDRIFQGLKTGADKVYIVEEIQRRANKVKIYSREKETEFWLEPTLLHPLVKGGDSDRYHLSRTSRLVLFPYSAINQGRTTSLPAATMKKDFPLTWAYLEANKPYLESREAGQMRGSEWYAYTRNQALDVIQTSKIFTPDIALRASFSLDETGELFFTGGVAGGYGIVVSAGRSRTFILGLLNSRLLDWYVQQGATQMRGGYYSYESRFIRGAPIVVPDMSVPTDKARHDRIVALVEKMLELNKKKHSGKLAPSELDRLEREIAATDAQIDDLVYELYGITAEERKIVEAQQ
ncbi:MAG: TaqI-like C-terminal specificity domain-containing protein, partial [Candidatus Acidiferrales bacterium]